MGDLSSDFGQLLQQGLFSDVTFDLDDGTYIRGHKAVIAARCPYFASLFSKDFSEADAHSVQILHLPATTFRALLAYIYTDRVSLHQANALPLLAAAQYYLLPGLQQRCEAHLAALLAAAAGLAPPPPPQPRSPPPAQPASPDSAASCQSAVSSPGGSSGSDGTTQACGRAAGSGGGSSVQARTWAVRSLPELWALADQRRYACLAAACQQAAAVLFEELAAADSWATLPVELLVRLTAEEGAALTAASERAVVEAVVRWAAARLHHASSSSCSSPPAAEWVSAVAAEAAPALRHIRWALLPDPPPPGSPDKLTPLARALADRHRPPASSPEAGAAAQPPRVTQHTTRLELDGKLGAAEGSASGSQALRLSLDAGEPESAAPRAPRLSLDAPRGAGGSGELLHIERWVWRCHRSLTRLDLSGCVGLRPAAARLLAACSGLEWLSLAGCALLDNAAVASVLQCTPRLAWLDLGALPRLTDGVMGALEGLYLLRHLSLAHCPRITDSAFHKVGQAKWGWVWCDSIEAVSLAGCAGVTPAGLARLALATPNLRRLAVPSHLAAAGDLAALRQRPGYQPLRIIAQD